MPSTGRSGSEFGCGISDPLRFPDSNLDLADVRRVIQRERLPQGIGRASVTTVLHSDKQAINPLSDTTIEAPRGVLSSLTGGRNSAASLNRRSCFRRTRWRIREAEIIVGAVMILPLKTKS
jgi:cell division GTPase FtsZ